MAETTAKVALSVAGIGALGAVVAALISAQQPVPPPPVESGSATSAPGVPAGGGSSSGPAGVPESYQGTWTGTLTLAVGNGAAQTMQFVYQIGPGRSGEVVGTFQQPTCAGQVVYESGTGPIQFTDQVTNNASGQCAPSARARAVLVDDATLSVSLFSGNVVVGQGVLSRP